jgi:hypothetical protein
MTSKRKKKRWADLSTPQRVAVVLGAAVQIALALAAWTDLARRKPAQVNGPKAGWAGIIGINFIGPILYFALGRQRD